jgi:transcriptional regulatory protein RtcR
MVDREIARLKRLWAGTSAAEADLIGPLLGGEAAAQIDRFDQVQLAETIRVCRASRSLSEAGRTLFSASRLRRSSANDADRLRKYLARFGLDWSSVADASVRS